MSDKGMRTPDDKSFGALLRRHRTSAALSHQALAVRAGVSAGAISDLERGVKSRPNVNTVRRLADALILDPADRVAFAAAARQPKRRSQASASASSVANQRRLPAPSTPLVGREREVVAIGDLLGREAVRLVTLTGLGGVGKTRLALAVASEVQATFADGVVFVDLSPVRDPALVASTIALALGVREGGERSLAEAIAAVLADRQLLLILDNFEQILPAAPLVTTLLRACPQLKILVTSRALLRVSGEQNVPVAPLALPEVNGPFEKLVPNAAIRLFADRAAAVRAGFVLTESNMPDIADVCHRLEGLPLAIELAASRLRALSLAELHALLKERLRLLTGGPLDVPSRHQTLRATLEWSYHLLTPPQQQLFQRHSVFSGGGTLEAISAVADQEEPFKVLEHIEALVDHSLLTRSDESGGPARFGMLETIREYVREQLAASGEEAQAHRRHAEFFVALGEAAEPHLHSPEQDRWIEHLTREHDNIRSALAWAQSGPPADPVLGLRLAGAIHLFWAKRAHFWEGLDWLERSLAKNPEAPAPVRAKALFAAGSLAGWLRNLPIATARFEESLSLYRLLGDRRGEGRVLAVRGIALLDQEDLERAIPLLNAALEINQETHDAPYAGLVTAMLGMATFHTGDRRQGIRLVERGLAQEQACGEQWGANMVQQMLIVLHFADGNYDQVARICLDQLARSTEEDIVTRYAAFVGLACVAWRQERYLQAAHFAGVADSFPRVTGITLSFGLYEVFPQAKAEVL
ncbi:MAG TPA: helix-turn-helix domain-containing protein, partial [Chloroflexota bacterium]|nr:helix-turn-helix domain-containing protein [Chloroflexota bacterium]